jgi:hypothetical protein
MSRVVRESPVEKITKGATIWAPDDGDWFKVARVRATDFGVEFSRADGSVAIFDDGKTVLLLVEQPPGPPTPPKPPSHRPVG